MGLQVVGYIKGKNAVYVARKHEGREKYFSGQHIWARGYFVSTVGMNEEVIRKYIRNQESEDRKTDQDLGLFSELG
ncbi:MAG: transposase [Spirochaetales bacterium]|nr:transposase [Spirochaetales bacterium]